MTINILILFAVLLIPGSLLVTNAFADPPSGVSISKLGDTFQIYTGLAWESTEGGPNLWSISNNPTDNNLRNLSSTDGSIIQTIPFQNSIDTCNDGCTDVSGGTALAIYGGILYAVVNLDNGEHLVTIDKSSGAFTDIGKLNHNFVGLAFDTAGILYGVTSDVDTMPSTLYTISTSDATTTLFLALGTEGDQAIAFNPDDEMLYYAAGSGEGSATFEKINLNTKEISTIDVSTHTELTNVPVASLTYSTDDKAFFWADTQSSDTLFKVKILPTQTLYGTDGSGNHLLLIDGISGTGTIVGTITFGPVPALAIDPTTGIIYAGQGGGSPNIYTIDPGTAQATLVGNTGLGFAAVSELAFNSTGTLFAAVNIAGDGGTGADHLAIIDKTTGIATVIGAFGSCTGVTVPSTGSGSCDLEGMEGIAFDPNGVLYGATTSRGAHNAGLQIPTLYTIDTSTGEATSIAPVLNSTDFSPSGGVASLAFDSSGRLYGGTSTAISPNADGGNLISIDPTNGRFSTIGKSTSGSSLAALAVVNIQKHHTALVLNQLNDVVAGTGISAIGTLIDTDANVGIDNKQITFTGTGATGVLAPVNTQGIVFTDASGMTVDNCPSCTPSLGSTNILHLHAGSYMTFPPGVVGVAFNLQDMGTNGFQMKITNGVGVQTVYSGSAAGDDITIFSPPSDLAGISRIDIISLTGGDPGNFGISEIKTANPGGDPTTIYDAVFGGVAIGSYPNLELLTGSYSSLGLTSSTVVSGLTVQAHFAGDLAFYPSDSSTLSYSTIFPTFGVGGTEMSGIVTNTATPLTSFLCSKLDPDNDRDSLCNSWESGPGIPYTVGASTFHYPLLGANQNHKDVYVEADAMSGVWSSTYQNAINNVVTAFTKAPLTKATQSQQKNPDGTNGINLHVQTDEVALTKVNALNVWTDTDAVKTNDYFAIKADHFGTVTEHPSIGGTQTNGPASSPASVSKTVTISGLTLTTPTLAVATRGDNTASATQGTITITQTVNLGAAVTITTPIAAPTQAGAAATVTWGPNSATIVAGAGTNKQTIVISIPFRTTGPVTAASLGTISTVLPLSASTTTGAITTANNSPSVSDTLLQAKAQAYRYALFADCITSCGAGTNPSGLAEQTGTPKAGNDLVIGVGPESGFSAAQNNIAGTFMHELGHTLGLQHGGPQYVYTGSTKTIVPDSSQNCKPNYESVMSYSRQFVTYLGNSWILNYSSGTFGPLTEAPSLSEVAGLVGNPTILSTPPTIVYGYDSGGNIFKGVTATTVNTGQANPGIDWNHDGDKTDIGLSLPIQDLGIAGCNTATPLTTPINDYNDWLNLNYNFTSTGSFNGLDPSPIYIPEITPTIVNQQIGQVTPNFILTWGSFGSGNGQFKVPTGTAVDLSGNVYVADSGNNRIEKFSNTGTFITKWGTTGSGNGQFKVPTGVAVDSSGNVYIADSGNNRIEKFSNTGTFITKWGSSGIGNGNFIVPTGVAADLSGNIYVDDSGNNRIEKFSNTGTFKIKWGSFGTGNGQFKVPAGVSVDLSSNVYVADSGNNRMEKFSGDGTFITKWGTTGSGNGQFKVPTGTAAIDASGNIYIADSGNNRIEKWGP